MGIKKYIKYFIVLIFFILIAMSIWFTAIGGTAYIYTGYLESRWIKENPSTMQELESILKFYSKHEITTAESSWGGYYILKSDERMIQYRILWNKNCPLDVVYNDKDKIVRMFTSYE